jgi:hypothetical protein
MVYLMQIYPFQVSVRSQCHKMAGGNLVEENLVVPEKIIGISWVMPEYLRLFYV